MGGIKSAVGFGNANSAFNNPASTADVKDMDVQFTSMTWVADIKYSSVSFVKNLGEWGSVGVSGMYVNYGDMIRTEVAEGFGPAGNSLGIIPITEGLGTFSAHDLALGLVYSRRVTDFLQVGGTLRYCEEQLDDAKMKTWSLDVGTMYWTGIGSLRISMLGKNFGPDGEFLSYEGRIAQSPAKVRLPMEFIFGAAYDILAGSQHRLTVAAEYLKPNDGPDRYHLGAEYFAFSNIYLRGGYRFNYDETSYSFGVGAEYSVADEVVIKFDYAYSDVGRFQAVHVPFRGSAPAITELLSGRIQATFENLPPSAPQIRAGGIRAIAMSTAQRLPDWPEIPTVAETWPGFEAVAWQALMAPVGTPMPLVQRVAQIVLAATEAQAARLRGMGIEPGGIGPDRFPAFLQAEISKWAEAVRLSGATAE